MLAKYIQENQKDWDLHLDFIVMAYNTCEHESTGCSPYKVLYGESIMLPIDILTDGIPDEESVNSERDVSSFVPQLQFNLKKTHAFVRKNLSKSADKQKKHYDCHVREMNYKVGDLVWRNQKKTVPGVKTKITRHWTGPWIITEKLCDVLFRIKHSEHFPSVIIHGDNLKKYCGPKTIVLKTDERTRSEADQPNLQSFVQACTQRVVSHSCANVVTDKVNRDGDSGVATKETHILLIRYDRSRNSLNKTCCEEIKFSQSLKDEISGCETKNRPNTFAVLLESCKSQDRVT
ncbi:MAG: hypothetical protein N0C90_19805 [Candidatus Thiodiazotropha endolucinida]|nr:hypothetical protein [Candidatus Thiodiazotropha taylori]MCW4263600.1 hypothetical protein [Candidatus Thiodiazotropha endolucinida]